MMLFAISSTAPATSALWLVCSCAPAAICSVDEEISLDALAVAETVQPRAVPIGRLQETLRRQGALVRSTVEASVAA